MKEKTAPHNLEQLLERIQHAAEESGGEVSWNAVLDQVGRRSFGPLLLVAGLVTLAPVIGDIPGVPSLVALLVILTSGQLLWGRNYFWLPGFLLRRSIAKEKLDKAVKWLRKPARFIDRFLRGRLNALVEGPMHYVIAGLTLAIALAMPVMEVIPFSANLAGGALTAFGLAMIARDGLLSLLALLCTGGIILILVATLL